MAKTTTPGGTKLPPLLGHSRGYVPLLRHALALKQWPDALLDAGRRRHGELFALDLAGQKTAVFSGPEAHEAYFRAPDDQLDVREVRKFMTPVFGQGVVYDCGPELMAEQLTFLISALKEQRLRSYVSVFNEELERYFAAWGEEGDADLYTSTHEVTTFIAARTLFGRDVRDRMSAEFAALYHDLQAGINLIAFYAPHLPLPSFRRRDRARERVTALVGEVVRERRRRGTVEEDFTQTLMEARYKSGRALADHEIAGLMVAALFGGQHTSAVLAAWGILELLRAPRLIGPLLAEQEAVLGGRGAPTIDDLRAMRRLERLVLETERLHPPLILLMRKVLRDLRYKDFVVPAGWLAMAAPVLSHRLPEVFARPGIFDPDRFAPPREEHKKAAYTLITFGGGKHRCTGMAFGTLQVRAVIAYLLRHFDLTLASRAPSPDYSGFVVGPKRPCLVRYRRRRRGRAAVAPGLDGASVA